MNKNKKYLTRHQYYVLGAIYKVNKLGVRVTLKILMSLLNYKGTSSVQRHIYPLRKKGFIDKHYNILKFEGVVEDVHYNDFKLIN